MRNSPRIVRMLENSSQKQIITVSQLNMRARQLLETHMSIMWVEGEISNFSRPSSGHWYFTLKDANAQVRCAMFRNRNQLVTAPPEHGQHVLVRARVSLYEGRGDYQLIVEHMEPAGFGALQRQFEILKQKLLSEGLFDQAHKRALPNLPAHIGVITSPTGAAIKDILTVLKRRFPSIPVSIFPVAVQGNDASRQICHALAVANQYSDCDVLILGRGGGSLEDLWPFNEESVARAIFDSKIPVVSAVGHEVDTTISDFVADLRAPTPSAAAELIVPNRNEIIQQLIRLDTQLIRSLSQQIERHRRALQALRSRLRHPGDKLQAQAQQMDHLEIRLQQAFSRYIHKGKTQLEHVQLRLQQLHPEKIIQQEQGRINQLQQRLQQLMDRQIKQDQLRLKNAMELLDTVSPLNTLKRGYAIVMDTHGKIIRSVNHLAPEQMLTTRLADGELQSRVIKSTKK